MIFKRNQQVEGMEAYLRRDRTVMAKQMREDFMVETMKDPGWERGRRGDWLVHIGGELWSAISDTEFKKIYRRMEPGSDCVGPCDDFGPERRKSKGDSRA